MRAMTHHGTDIAQVDLPYRKVALPAHHVQRIERIENLRIFVFALDADYPLAAAALERGRRRLRRDDHPRIVERRLPDQPFLRLLKLAMRLDDQEKIIITPGNQAI